MPLVVIPVSTLCCFFTKSPQSILTQLMNKVLDKYDLFIITLLLLGILYIQTLEKLPQILPKTKNAKYNTNYIFICEATCKIPSIQN